MFREVRIFNNDIPSPLNTLPLRGAQRKLSPKEETVRSILEVSLCRLQF